MNFELKQAVEILERTPAVLEYLLRDISEDWQKNNEGGESWSPYDVIGHLIHGEKTDWIPRLKIILSDTADKKFEPFDRLAQFENSRGKSINDLLTEFKTERHKNISYLLSLSLTQNELSKTGVHPQFGKVTLRQLLATWVAHDLGHIAQITRVMARQYAGETGPWVEYLPVLNARK